MQLAGEAARQDWPGAAGSRTAARPDPAIVAVRL